MVGDWSSEGVTIDCCPSSNLIFMRSSWSRTWSILLLSVFRIKFKSAASGDYINGPSNLHVSWAFQRYMTCLCTPLTWFVSMQNQQAKYCGNHEEGETLGVFSSNLGNLLYINHFIHSPVVFLTKIRRFWYVNHFCESSRTVKSSEK